MEEKPLEITAAELQQKLREDPDAIQLVDVRAPWEHETVSFPGDVLLPLQTLGARFHELPRERALVVYCHHGSRSYMAARALRQAGFDVVSLRGGIEQWAREIDPTMRRY